MNISTASTQWATRPSDERFQTLDSLLESVQNRRMKSRAVDVALSSVSARVEGSTIALNRGLSSVEPTHWSFGQLSSWIGAPADYLRKLPAPLAVENINHGIQALGKERGDLKFMAITREDSEVNTLQAVTSTTYGRIWDVDCVSAVQRIVERSGGRFRNPKAYAHRGSADGFRTIDTSRTEPSGLYASDRDVFMFLIDGGSILDAGPRAKLNRGFIVSNSEVGARTFTLTTFLFNMVCGNHIIWGASDVKELKIRHTQNGPSRFDSEASPALLAYVNSSPGPEEAAIRRAQERMLPVPIGKDLKPLLEWFKQRGFSQSEARGAIDSARAEEGSCSTYWDAVQGLTAYARGYDYIDARTALEARAGRILEECV